MTLVILSILIFLLIIILKKSPEKANFKMPCQNVCQVSKLKDSFEDDLKLKSIKEKLLMIDPRVKDINFFINSEEAYTLNKKEIHMCLKEPSGNYYSDNVLIYIALHELAHVILPFDTSNHPPIFDEIFQQLQEKATILGLYNPSIPFPDEYCGNKISYY